MNTPIRTVIVDDEPVGRRGLRVLLQRIPNVEVVGEAGEIAEALRQIRTARPDVVLLDIEMPGGNGFELLNSLDADETPIVIFVTAYSEHAVHAFERAALDYVLKPVHPERLALAIDRARELRSLRQRVHAAAAAAPNSSAPASRLSLRIDGAIRVISTDDIEAIEAAGNYCCIQTGGRPLIIRETLSSVEARLDPALFARVHKSTIVAVRELATLQPLPNRDAVAVLKSGRKVRVSRQYRDRLDRLVGAPLG